jgi:NMD protein affecting ribosome stability and mRNA decay
MTNNKSLENLNPNYSKWNNKTTVTIRIPEILKPDILDYAHKLDKSTVTVDNNSIEDRLRAILAKIDSNGYKRNSAGKLLSDLSDLKSLLDD